MRTMMSAFGCIAAVACGSLLVHLDARVVLLVVLLVVLAGTVALACRRPAEARTVAVAGLLACTGLMRGASGGPAQTARVTERGWSAGPGLRSFEVVGASEPGPRCTLELRDPRAGLWSPTITVSAPIEACPRSSGDPVAVLAPRIARDWRGELLDRDHTYDLGRGPVIWRRPGTGRSALWRPIDAYWRWVAQLRQRAWASTRGDTAASLVVAAGLGLRSALAPGPRDDLRSAGLGHLIAVSGLHVAIAALWLQVVARRGAAMLSIPPSHACALAWLPLWAYVGLTGGAASAVRAAAMLTAVDLGTVVGRPTHGPTTLANVAAAMLLLRPDWLLDPGFALSLAAMAAIVSAPRGLGVLAMSWRITWATAPLSVLCFDVAPLHGLLGNAVALPLFGLMMPAALVACVVPAAMGGVAMAVARLFASPILDLAALLARVPAVGPLGLLCAALLGLALRRIVTARRIGDHGHRGWLPPRLACVLAILLSTVLLVDDARERRRPPAPPSFDWIAVGTVRSRSLLVADPSTPTSACLYRPTDSSATWRRLLELEGVRRLSRLDAALPKTSELDAGAPAPDPAFDPGPATDPRTRALARELGRAGFELPLAGQPDRCRPPTPAEVRAGLRACRYRQGGRGRALVRSRAGVLSCRIKDRWVVDSRAPEGRRDDPER